MWFWYAVAASAGFVIAWLVGKVLASREFDQLLTQNEKDKQELIDKFNAIIYAQRDELDQLKGEKK